MHLQIFCITKKKKLFRICRLVLWINILCFNWTKSPILSFITWLGEFFSKLYASGMIESAESNWNVSCKRKQKFWTSRTIEWFRRIENSKNQRNWHKMIQFHQLNWTFHIQKSIAPKFLFTMILLRVKQSISAIFLRRQCIPCKYISENTLAIDWNPQYMNPYFIKFTHFSEKFQAMSDTLLVQRMQKMEQNIRKW